MLETGNSPNSANAPRNASQSLHTYQNQIYSEFYWKIVFIYLFSSLPQTDINGQPIHLSPTWMIMSCIYICGAFSWIGLLAKEMTFNRTFPLNVFRLIFVILLLLRSTLVLIEDGCWKSYLPDLNDHEPYIHLWSIFLNWITCQRNDL